MYTYINHVCVCGDNFSLNYVNELFQKHPGPGRDFVSFWVFT